MKVASYRTRWNKYHQSYERKAYKTFRRVFKQWTKDIDFDSLTESNYKSVVSNAVKEKTLLDAYATTYIEIGSKHGERIGRLINRSAEKPKFFSLEDFTSGFIDFIYNWLNNNKVADIRRVQFTYQEAINRLIAEGMKDGKSIRDIAKEIQALVNRPKFYRWQALRIARTETTSASNLAAYRAGANTTFVVDKMWISSQDARTRRLPDATYDHYHMNQVRVAYDEDFIVPGKNFEDRLTYPGDPKGQAGNIINCRCSLAIVPRRDSNGRLIMKKRP